MNEYRNYSPDERRRNEARKKAKLKSRIILIQFILIMILVISIMILGIKYGELSSKLSELKNGNLSSDTESTSSNTSDNTVNPDLLELDEWYLKLVGPNDSIDNDFINSVELERIDERFTTGRESSIYFDKRAIEHLNNMFEAALKDNVSLISVSSYRTYSYQNTLYNNRVQRFINQGYNEADAKTTAATIVALPGTSEHHLGLAVDINEVEETFENTNAFKWLQKHAAEYGFVMRYPKDKQEITKIIYEPWHYRYVGVKHATAMNDLDMCLEEYIDYIKNGGKN